MKYDPFPVKEIQAASSLSHPSSGKAKNMERERGSNMEFWFWVLMRYSLTCEIQTGSAETRGREYLQREVLTLLHRETR